MIHLKSALTDPARQRPRRTAFRISHDHKSRRTECHKSCAHAHGDPRGGVSPYRKGVNP